MAISFAGTWTLYDAAGVQIGPCPIPGDVHSALLAAGRIPDPMVGRNEAAVQWVGDATWEIRRRFTLDGVELVGKWAVLDLEFVDTFADVMINGFNVGRIASSFIRHRLDVSDVLRAGENEIALRFLPAAAEARAIALRQPFPIPRARDNRVDHLNMIRKAQCHAGWDWGPCLMVIGVYAEPKLHLFDGVRIEHLVIRQKHHDDGEVTVSAEVELAALKERTIPLLFTFGGATVSANVAVTRAGAKISLAIDVDDPALWWPAGHGGQPLYDAVVAIPGDQVARRVGLRRLEAVNEPDAAGTSLFFRVNGSDIFCKGANWIPADSLPSRITRERVRRLLVEAVAANMNMIRVWGGGFYEFDDFYDACDELGLLVWQDMMFACSQYPSTPQFLDIVDAEIRYQAKRLASHPSIALWCGDNEIIGSLNWYEESKKNRDRYLVNYDRLNRTIEKAVSESDPDRRFWPSSPCSGTLDYGDAWHDDSRGDMHFWSVWHESKDFEHYYDVRPRFCSEFGFQSFPTLTTIGRFAEPADCNPSGPVMEFHQRDRAGNGRIVETMTRYFRMPRSFEAFVYLSQLQQALAIETAVRHWRCLKPHSMGTIYWQLNDVWPAVSWSSIDYFLAWKTLHYHARRFFAAVATSSRLEDGQLVVSAVNDRHQAVTVVVRVQRVSLDGRTIAEDTTDATVPSERAVRVGRFDAPASEDYFFIIDAREGTALGLGYDSMLRTVVFPVRPKSLAFREANITIEPGPRPSSFAFSTDRPAFFVRPEAPAFDGAFDDASFLLLPGEKRIIGFRSFDTRIPEAKEISVMHLAETYR
jgi:beta-mannosidase